MSHARILWCIAGIVLAAAAIWDIRSALQSGTTRWFSAPFNRTTSAGEFWFAITYKVLGVLGGLTIAGLAYFS